MRVRPLVQVVTADRAEARAIRTAERGDRGHEDELLPQERREVDLEVGADRLRVQRGLDEADAAVDGDGGVVLLGEVGVDRGVDRLQAAGTLRSYVRVGRAFEVRPGVRVGRVQARVDIND